MTTPTIKQMRAWQRQLGSMERKADEIAREMPKGLFAKKHLDVVMSEFEGALCSLADGIALEKIRNRRQGFASMTPERVAELSRLAVEAKRAKKTV